MDYRLELINVPVSDVDRSIAYYTEKLGFNLDHDYDIGGGVRFVQITPPGSACSISIGTGLTQMAPGSLQGLQCVVDDAEAVHAELSSRGVDVSDVQTFDWGTFVFCKDPDGNGWAFQQLPDRG